MLELVFAASTSALSVVSFPLHPISYPLQNPGTQTAHVLSLTMVELVEKLKEGSLSPESVLYSYMGKVSDTSNMGEMLRGYSAVGAFKSKNSSFAERTGNAGDYSLSIV